MEKYKEKHKILPHVAKAMGAIEKCRTAELGARIGFMEVLHTWGQTLVYHPHIHCIVAAGGIAISNNRIVKEENGEVTFKYYYIYYHQD